MSFDTLCRLFYPCFCEQIFEKLVRYFDLFSLTCVLLQIIELLLHKQSIIVLWNKFLFLTLVLLALEGFKLLLKIWLSLDPCYKIPFLYILKAIPLFLDLCHSFIALLFILKRLESYYLIKPIICTGAYLVSHLSCSLPVSPQSYCFFHYFEFSTIFDFYCF